MGRKPARLWPPRTASPSWRSLVPLARARSCSRTVRPVPLPRGYVWCHVAAGAVVAVFKESSSWPMLAHLSFVFSCGTLDPNHHGVGWQEPKPLLRERRLLTCLLACLGLYTDGTPCLQVMAKDDAFLVQPSWPHANPVSQSCKCRRRRLRVLPTSRSTKVCCCIACLCTAWHPTSACLRASR